jgi:hypothetical protein
LRRGAIKPMASYGSYDELSARAGGTIGFAVFLARSPGAKRADTILKVFRPIDTIQFADHPDAAAAEYRNIFNQFYGGLGPKDVPNLLKPRDQGEQPGEFWYALPFFGNPVTGKPNSLRTLVQSAVPATSEQLHNIVSAIVRALMGMREARQRGHGKLSLSNVLYAHLNSSAEIFVTDPVLERDPSPEEDLRAIGEIIYQIVTRREIQNEEDWPIPPLSPSPEWERLGKASRIWLGMADRLLDSHLQADTFDLQDIQRELARIKPTKKMLVPALIGAAAVIVIGAIALFGHARKPHEAQADIAKVPPPTNDVFNANSTAPKPVTIPIQIEPAGAIVRVAGKPQTQLVGTNGQRFTVEAEAQGFVKTNFAYTIQGPGSLKFALSKTRHHVKLTSNLPGETKFRKGPEEITEVSGTEGELIEVIAVVLNNELTKTDRLRIGNVDTNYTFNFSYSRPDLSGLRTNLTIRSIDTGRVPKYVTLGNHVVSTSEGSTSITFSEPDFKLGAKLNELFPARTVQPGSYRLTLTSDPGEGVAFIVDGQPSEKTTPDLAPGKHKIVAKLTGFKDDAKEIVLLKNDSLSFEFPYCRIDPANLVPPGGDLSIDNVKIDLASANKFVAAGRRTVRYSFGSYEPYNQPVELPNKGVFPDKRVVLNAKMKFVSDLPVSYAVVETGSTGSSKPEARDKYSFEVTLPAGSTNTIVFNHEARLPGRATVIARPETNALALPDHVFFTNRLNVAFAVNNMKVEDSSKIFAAFPATNRYLVKFKYDKEEIAWTNDTPTSLAEIKDRWEKAHSTVVPDVVESKEFINSIGMVFVRITDSLWVGKYEVSQAQFTNFFPKLGEELLAEVANSTDPDWTVLQLKDSGKPMANLAVQQAMDFCEKLNQFEKGKPRAIGEGTYGLPTVKEYEKQYGAAADEDKKFEGVGSKRTPIQLVRAGPTNKFGLVHVGGNVREFCLDGFGAEKWTTRGGAIGDTEGFDEVAPGEFFFRGVADSFNPDRPEKTGADPRTGFRLVFRKTTVAVANAQKAAAR